MKRFAILLAVAATSVGAPIALSSPGGLDSRGGHHCWTNCARYGLKTGQYHCHRAPCSQADVLHHRRHGH